jgi:integrase
VFVYLPRGEELPRPVKSIKRSFASACATAKLTGVTPHALRHHVGSRLGALNVPAAAVQARLGHARLETTLNYYTHETDDGKRLAADEVDKMIIAAEKVN